MWPYTFSVADLTEDEIAALTAKYGSDKKKLENMKIPKLWNEETGEIDRDVLSKLGKVGDDSLWATTTDVKTLWHYHIILWIFDVSFVTSPFAHFFPTNPWLVFFETAIMMTRLRPLLILIVAVIFSSIIFTTDAYRHQNEGELDLSDQKWINMMICGVPFLPFVLPFTW